MFQWFIDKVARRHNAHPSVKKFTGDKKGKKTRLDIEYHQNLDVRAYDQRASMTRAFI